MIFYLLIFCSKYAPCTSFHLIKEKPSPSGYVSINNRINCEKQGEKRWANFVSSLALIFALKWPLVSFYSYCAQIIFFWYIPTRYQKIYTYNVFFKKILQKLLFCSSDLLILLLNVCPYFDTSYNFSYCDPWHRTKRNF